MLPQIVVQCENNGDPITLKTVQCDRGITHLKRRYGTPISCWGGLVRHRVGHSAIYLLVPKTQEEPVQPGVCRNKICTVIHHTSKVEGATSAPVSCREESTELIDHFQGSSQHEEHRTVNRPHFKHKLVWSE